MFKYSCLHSPPHFPHPSHPHLPPSILPPFSSLSMHPLYMFLDNPLSPPTSPSHLPSGYCQFVLNFSVSGYILLACLLFSDIYRSMCHLFIWLAVNCIYSITLQHWLGYLIYYWGKAPSYSYFADSFHEWVLKFVHF